MPFIVSERDGVLTLTLDTPGSPVNIFNQATARQLLDVLAGVSPATTRAVVFDSAKPNSFLNGVGLLLAHASRTLDDVERASELPWAAYRAVYESPVPTIALVQGTCFGCGVEFALSCDYRVATDSGETQFYMTELNDYLFIPLFGSTWNLPEAVGLADAVDLLLWGSRWGAARAEARGLVDEVVPFTRREECAQRFIDRVLDGRQRSRRRGRIAWGPAEDEVVAGARERITALPPAYRPVYTDALELLRTGAEQRGTYVEHQRRELARSAASALAPIGKAAYAFFYLRQMAAERAAGRARTADEPAALSVDIDARSVAWAFGETLRARRFPGARFEPADRAEFRLVAADGADEASHGKPDRSSVDGARTPPPERARRPREVAVRLGLARGPTAALEVYAPGHSGGGRLVELATATPRQTETRPDGDVARLARTLQRFGFEVARTTPGSTFVTTRLLMGFLVPLVRFIEAGGKAPVANATLRESGFVRSPRDVVAPLERDALVGALAAASDRSLRDPAAVLADLTEGSMAHDRMEPLLLDALCISLLEAAEAARATRAIPDPSVIDLVARELLDFPRHLVSLCTWLKRARVVKAVTRAEVRPLVTRAAFETAVAFAAEGREFYR